MGNFWSLVFRDMQKTKRILAYSAMIITSVSFLAAMASMIAG